MTFVLKSLLATEPLTESKKFEPPKDKWPKMKIAVAMRFEAFSFGSIRIDGLTYDHDVVIDRGKVRKRRKKPSKKFRKAFGHIPLSIEEKIPWRCRRLVIGTGTGALPVMKDIKREAKRRNVQLIVVPTSKALDAIRENPDGTNAILHITC